MNFLKELWKDENGAVATEYVILVGLIAIALIGVLIAFRTALTDRLNVWIEKLSGKEGTATDPGIKE